MTPSQDRMVCGQEENREHMYRQAKGEIMGERMDYSRLSELEEMHIDQRYKELCKQSNITPW